MSQSEIHQQIKQAHAEGESKQSIYERFKNQGRSQQMVAQMVGSLPSQSALIRYRALHTTLMIVILVIAAPLLCWGGYIQARATYVSADIMYFFCAAIGGVFPLTSIIGIYQHKLPVYNNFIALGTLAILLSVVFVIKFHYSVSILYVMAIVVGVGVLALAVYTRNQLFPSVTFMGKVKTDSKGHYQFRD